jgi:methionyl-tRNA synthetase
VDRADASDIEAYHAAMDGSRGFLLHEALRRVMATVTRGNEYVQASQPWNLAKSDEDRTELETVLASLVRALARQSVMLHSFMPEKTAELWGLLGAPGRIENQRITTLMKLDATGWRVRKGSPLFPKSVATAT